MSVENYTPNIDHRTPGEYREEDLVGEKGGARGKENCWLFLNIFLSYQAFSKNNVLLS